MQLHVLDFESFFDSDYTLSKLTTEAYVRDPRFEALGLAHICGPHRMWVTGPEIKSYLRNIDWQNDAVLAHHAQFDGLILSHHYGRKPRFWYDTLSMARVRLGVHLGASLDSLSRHFNLAAKSVPYNEFKGKRYSDLAGAGSLLHRLGAGALHDAELTLDIFNRLIDGFWPNELALIDLTVRMFTEPVLEADTTVLNDLWMSEEKRRRSALEELGVTEKELQSNVRFAEILEAEGVEVEYKEGKTGPIPCFAKTDQFMEDLLEHPDSRVASLAASRLGLRSTIDQTRAERLGYMATRGRLPVYLRYCGAHTTRWSGGDKVNWQNFRRGGLLRKSIIAPPGAVCTVVDSAQIECRVLNCFAGQEDVLEKFRTGADPYIGIASQAYGREITKADKAERGTGKQLELSCGYQAGSATIQRTARLGIYGPPVEIDLNEALRWRDLYRATHPFVVQLWKEAEGVLARMYNWQTFEWRCLTVFCNETAGARRVFVPGYPPLIYDTLDWDAAEQQYRVKTRKGFPTRMYGGKLVENVVQYMARLIIGDAAVRIANAGIKIATTTHDELVGVVPEAAGERALDLMVKEMCTAPEWMPDLPLAAEGHVTRVYGDAK